jgi:hypothetical protein
VGDAYVTREEVAEVFGNQSAAAGTLPIVGDAGAPSGTSTSGPPDTDLATTATRMLMPLVATDSKLGCAIVIAPLRAISSVRRSAHDEKMRSGYQH